MKTPQKRNKSGGCKLTRTETVTVRLDPKTRYMADLAARRQRRTLSSFIEWAVEQALHGVCLIGGVTADEMTHNLWDVDESERFARLAIYIPELLTYEEQEKWKMLNESDILLHAKVRGTDGVLSWNFAALKDKVFPELRKHWQEMNEAYDEGEEAIRQWIDSNTIPF